MTLPIVANAMGYDRALAALFFGAKRGETVSQRCALWRQAGLRRGCWACAILDALVAPDHCEQSLADDGVITGAAAWRSGALLLAAALALSLACWAAWAGLFWACRRLF